MLLLAWCLGWWLARRRARSLEIPGWKMDALVPLLIVSCGLGTRFAGILQRSFSGDQANDRVLYGGVLLCMVTGALYARLARVPLARLADAFAFSLPLGIGILRVGCFLAGCCWGDVCGARECLAVVDDQSWRHQVQTIPTLCDRQWPLQVRYPADSPAFYQHLTAGLLATGAVRSLPVHPVQLYEAVASWILLSILVLFDRRLRRYGMSFVLCVLGYCVIRFVTEWFRADSRLLPGDLTAAQYVSMGGACACVVLLAARNLLAPRTHRRLLPMARATAADV